MAGEDNVIDLESFAAFKDSNIADKIFQKACSAEVAQNGTCKGEHNEIGLGTALTCRPATCAFTVNINSTGCVNIYVSQIHNKPTAENSEYQFTSYNGTFSKVLDHPEMQNEMCQNQNPFHYSIIPCANSTGQD